MVPLPDGRTIPVTMTNRGEDGTRIYVVANYEQAIQQGLRRHRDIVVDVVAGDVKKNGKVGKSIRRGG
jgi:hypothetical protein